MVLNAQTLPRGRMAHASASYPNDGYSRDRVNHATASPWILAILSFEQRVVRPRGCTRATSTNRVTRSRAPRVRVTQPYRAPRDRVTHATASPASHNLSRLVPIFLSFLLRILILLIFCYFFLLSFLFSLTSILFYLIYLHTFIHCIFLFF